MTTQASETPSKICKIKTIRPLATVSEIPIPTPIPLDIRAYIGRSIPPGVDLHLDMADIITLFRLNKTLIYKKLDRESEEYDKFFPSPVYPSPRKPVWILSELVAWQESLKAKRNAGGGK